MPLREAVLLLGFAGALKAGGPGKVHAPKNGGTISCACQCCKWWRVQGLAGCGKSGSGAPASATNSVCCGALTSFLLPRDLPGDANRGGAPDLFGMMVVI